MLYQSEIYFVKMQWKSAKLAMMIVLFIVLSRIKHRIPLGPKDVNRSSVIAKHVHRWFPVTVASQALTGQTMGRYTLWVLGFIENRLGNALNANP